MLSIFINIRILKFSSYLDDTLTDIHFCTNPSYMHTVKIFALSMTWKVLTSGTPFSQCLKTFYSNLWKIEVSILSSQKTLPCHVLTILFENISTAQTN